ncbi:GAF and ANTAR domain-containing protein [Actinomadura napierensis]|uniref:GAF and ANTAR domain-containing protein n=1 Tax=Actinomadura napierensis TaxID=267854 RepID=A0ABN2XW32_9ACTN
MADEPAQTNATTTRLQSLLLETTSVEDFLQEVVELAVGEAGPGLSCGITMRAEGRALTVASSDVLAEQVDEVQYGLKHGPCLHSLDTGDRIYIEDLAAAERWADYASRALAHGVRSSLSLPLQVPGASIGAMNLYARTPHAFPEDRTRTLEGFAQLAAGALAIASRLAAGTALADQLQAALASRSVIDQALGVLMGQQRCTADAAFAILRTASQNRNVKLRDIAAQIVTAVSGAPPQPTPFNIGPDPAPQSS